MLPLSPRRGDTIDLSRGARSDATLLTCDDACDLESASEFGLDAFVFDHVDSVAGDDEADVVADCCQTPSTSFSSFGMGGKGESGLLVDGLMQVCQSSETIVVGDLSEESLFIHAVMVA